MTRPERERLWEEAKRRCRLSSEAVRMAKEMGLNPKKLMGNAPSRSEPWKVSTEEWIRHLHARRHPPRASGPG